ncbi:hypothetical protein IL306_009795 [Fusarium sp. DS 682]|nr:hypothetical protein IL306_009795 [Fusarium sp. DS 682]
MKFISAFIYLISFTPILANFHIGRMESTFGLAPPIPLDTYGMLTPSNKFNCNWWRGSQGKFKNGREEGYPNGYDYLGAEFSAKGICGGKTWTFKPVPGNKWDVFENGQKIGNCYGNAQNSKPSCFKTSGPGAYYRWYYEEFAWCDSFYCKDGTPGS